MRKYTPGYFTEKAKQVKAAQEAEMNELLNLVAEAVETQYNEDLEVLENV